MPWRPPGQSPRATLPRRSFRRSSSLLHLDRAICSRWLLFRPHLRALPTTRTAASSDPHPSQSRLPLATHPPTRMPQTHFHNAVLPRADSQRTVSRLSRRFIARAQPFYAAFLRWFLGELEFQHDNVAADTTEKNELPSEPRNSSREPTSVTTMFYKM